MTNDKLVTADQVIEVIIAYSSASIIVIVTSTRMWFDAEIHYFQKCSIIGGEDSKWTFRLAQVTLKHFVTEFGSGNTNHNLISAAAVSL